MTLEVLKAIDFLPSVPVRKETKKLSSLLHGDIRTAKLMDRTIRLRGKRYVEFDFENGSFMEYDCS